MSKQNSVVGIYNTHTDAEAAVKELQKSGFEMKKLSVVGKDYHTEENVVGFYNAGDRMKFWGKLGAFWGGLWAILFGSAFFVIPGLGQLVVLGPLVMIIVSALEGAVVTGGLTALGAGLYSIGIPRDSIIKYETALKSDKFLVISPRLGRRRRQGQVDPGVHIQGRSRGTPIVIRRLALMRGRFHNKGDSPCTMSIGFWSLADQRNIVKKPFTTEFRLPKNTEQSFL